MIFTNGFVTFPEAIKDIIQRQRTLDVPEWLKEFSLFDCIPGCKWSGGRYTEDYYKPFNLDVIKEFNDLDVGIFPTFTNSFFKDINDPYLNEVLEVLSQCESNGVILSSSVLNEHVKNNFKRLKRSCSISSTEHTYKDFINTLREYDFVCLKQRAYTLEIPDELKEKCEVLCDNSCSSDCPYYKRHYQMVSKALLQPFKQENKTLNHVCFYKKKTEIFDKTPFVKMGFKTFKFAMRSYPVGVQVSAIQKHLDDLNNISKLVGVG